LIAAFRIARAGRLAWNQAVDVAGAEGVQRELLSRGAVRLREERRHALRTQLILEPVDEILGRKPIRRPAVIAEQIANGVVVLTVRQPAQERIAGR
jgi:hypothetical protein